MPTLSALIGLVRQVSSSLLAQVRGRGLSLNFAFMLCAVASLCLFDPTEANAHQRTLLRRNVASELEVYFTAWPAATYCHIVNLTHEYRYDDADYVCFIWMRMTVLSMITTPMYRLCHLMKLFHIEDHGLLVQDTLLQADMLTWDDCYFDVRNETKRSADCAACKIAVVCGHQVEYSNGPECATATEGNIDVEYCHGKDKVNATEASKRCADKSSALVDMKQVRDPLHHSFGNDPSVNREFWLDLTKEDLREVSGLVAFDLDDIDWNMPCITVWLGALVPWFYKRNCSQLYPVICEDSTYDWSKQRRYIAVEADCVYFTAWPAATYCHIVNLTHEYTYDDADYVCFIWMRMTVLSMITTPMYRLCHLMKLFHIEDHGLLVQDTLLQADMLTWDDCYFDVRNETKRSADCTACKIAVVCAHQVEYSNGPECATATEGNIDVEYCHGKDKVNATEASKRCADKSSALVDMKQMPDPLHNSFENDPSVNREFWLDLTKEDLREVSGLLAFDLDDIDWNMPCITVWLGALVPWFYKRNCSQLYPVICEGSTYDWSKQRRYIAVEADCANVSVETTHCQSEGGTFNKTTASEFCANHRLLLLNAKTFYRVLGIVFRSDEQSPPWFDQSLEIWDARSKSSRQHSIDECLAFNLYGSRRIEWSPRNCSEELRYLCRKSHPPKTHGFTCENASLPNMAGSHPACRTNLERPYPVAARVCDALGMELLPGTVENKFITNIIKHYEDYTHRGRDRLYWLDVPPPSGNSSVCSAALYGDDGIATALSGLQCNTSLHSLCVFTNIKRRSTVAPSTSETTMDIASDNIDIGNGTVSDVAS
ncbi:uncharacterized protein [Dermacentor albipictus]|uniref:uncharacterized protein isoform X2 n=1 Tax=Dermacentor albipictus TaxID=60249 RepID=UPI0031FCB9A6